MLYITWHEPKLVVVGLSSQFIKVHCCGVEEKGHCFAIEYKNEVLFLDAGFNISKNYYKFLDLRKDAMYAENQYVANAPKPKEKKATAHYAKF